MRARRSDPGPQHWEPSLWRRLLRRRAVVWGVAGVLALTSGAIVAGTTADAARLRDSFGTTSDVLVVSRTVTAGAELAGAVDRRTLPLAAIPDDAVEDLDDLGVSTTAAGPISAGAVLTVQDLSGRGGLGPGEAAVAIPRDATVPTAAPGSAVWVVVAADPYTGIESGLVAGRILSTADDRVTVVVPVADLTRVSAAIGAGAAGLALRGS